jgi:hypothetical protein
MVYTNNNDNKKNNYTAISCGFRDNITNVFGK